MAEEVLERMATLEEHIMYEWDLESLIFIYQELISEGWRFP